MSKDEEERQDLLLMQQAAQEISELRTQRNQLGNLILRFLDLCPRMNDDDPIGPALREVCTEAKEIVRPFYNKLTKPS